MDVREKGEALANELQQMLYTGTAVGSAFMQIDADEELHHRHVFDFQRAFQQFSSALDLMHMALDEIHRIDWTPKPTAEDRE